MSSHGRYNDLSQSNSGKWHLAITARLYQAIGSMHHIDELFLWLMEATAQTFDIQVTQWWVLQSYTTGQQAMRLRAMFRQDHSLPQHTVANQQIASTIQSLLNRPEPIFFQKVENVFSIHQGNLLMRYGLHYCCCYFLKHPALLPPSQQASPVQEIPAPLIGISVCFTRHPLSPDILSAIHLILEQALPLAEARGLLLPAHAASIRQMGPQQSMQFELSQIIPSPIEDATALKTSNPFAGDMVIPDKQARRLYAAIDGRKNLATICAALHMQVKDVYPALHYLLIHRRIQLLAPNGQIIDSSQFLGQE